MDAAQVEAYVAAAATALALPLAPEHRPGVLLYFGFAASQADLLMAVPLTAGDEPAEAFTPISPEDLAVGVTPER